MYSAIISICKLSNIITDEIKAPRIDAQPEIFVANITSPTTIIGAWSIDGQIQKSKVLSLEFSIDYGIPIHRDLNKLTGYFNIDEVEICLNKFQKKNFSGEVYMEKIHKPQAIKLPSRTVDLYGFSLYRAFYIRECKYHRLNSGCQLISIYYDIGFGKIITTDKLTVALINLRYLLNLPTKKDAETFAFQFVVRLKNEPRSKKKFVKPLYSNMFKVVFKEQEYSVWTEEVNPSEYHRE